MKIEEMLKTFAMHLITADRAAAAKPKTDVMAAARAAKAAKAQARKQASKAAPAAKPASKTKAKPASKAKAKPARLPKVGTEVDCGALTLVVQAPTKRRNRTYAAVMLGDVYCGNLRIDDAKIRRKVAAAIGGDFGAAIELIGG